LPAAITDLAKPAMSIPEITDFVSFRLTFDVYFTSFDHENYPMAITSTTDAFEIHGLGPVYGQDKGHLSAYIYTTEHLGPHGRGITGHMNQGWLRSTQRLEPHRWYAVTFVKSETSLTMIVDGVEVTEQFPFQGRTFQMKTPGALVVPQNNNGPVRIRNLHVSNGFSDPRESSEIEQQIG
jgi:hypothetical protein